MDYHSAAQLPLGVVLRLTVVAVELEYTSLEINMTGNSDVNVLVADLLRMFYLFLLGYCLW
jgi:hypothetical protein